jgi:hypothetical protein
MTKNTIPASGFFCTPRLAAGQKVAVFTEGYAEFHFAASPNSVAAVPYTGPSPTASASVRNGHGVYTLPADGYVNIVADEQGAEFDYGAEAWVLGRSGRYVSNAAVTIAATATLTVAHILAQKIIATTAAATTLTTPTGAIIDAALSQGRGLETSRAFRFSVINTGGVNTATMAGGSGVTTVGNMVVGISSSGQFELMRTAVATYTLTRMS